MSNERTLHKEWLKCSKSCAYLLYHYVYIENATNQGWVRFFLWPAQVGVLKKLGNNRQVIALKARQLGITWLVLGYFIWLMLFRPAATVLLFSKADKEAMELLTRLKGMYERLPDWMKCKRVEIDSAHEWKLSNGSRALAFATTGGRSFTGTAALVDEADFIPNLAAFLNAVKPTVDAGGQIVLISTVDKARPLSAFKLLFQAARRGENNYKSIFLPWSARPERTQAWYDRIAADMRSQGNGDDDLFQEYPATVEQALAPLQKDKRFAFAWLEKVATNVPVYVGLMPAVPGLVVFYPPQRGRRYLIGADSAEGNPKSDDSAAVVLDAQSYVQVAALGGKLEPAIFADYINQVALYYNNAAVMPERNNHGHATILALRMTKAQVLKGPDDKFGWLSNAGGKKLLYDWAAEALQAGHTELPHEETRIQLASIEGNTLRAPEGMHDDYADAYCLAVAGARSDITGEGSTEVPADDPLEEYDRGQF